MQERTMSPVGLALTMEQEGLRLEAYPDAAGVWTIGYGHTGADVYEGQRIGEFEAMLRADLAASVRCVNRGLERAVSQGQFDALVDFCFNVGCGHFRGSSLLEYVNQGNDAAAIVQFGQWIHAGGRVVEGLVRRRAAEAAMFRVGTLTAGAQTVAQTVK